MAVAVLTCVPSSLPSHHISAVLHSRTPTNNSKSSNRYAGTTDPDGCDFNSYRMGNTNFYGPGMTVDTTKKFTVVTQFIGDPLTEIKRFYVQNNKLIPNSQATIANVTGNSITQEFCDTQKAAFGDNYKFKDLGGLAQMGKALSAGMVLVMSVWDDHYSNMLVRVSLFQCFVAVIGSLPLRRSTADFYVVAGQHLPRWRNHRWYRQRHMRSLFRRTS